MSRGEKGGGKPFDWTRSEENTSISTSNSGSEHGSELDVAGTVAGLATEENVAGRKAEQSAGRAGEISGRGQQSQQLKYYGRRNRAKQTSSVRVREVSDVEVEGGGLVGCSALDLTEQLESGNDGTQDQSVTERNGSNGMVSSKQTSMLKRSGSSGDVRMDSGEFQISKINHVSEAVDAEDTRKAVDISESAGYSVDSRRLVGKTGLCFVDSEGNGKKSGLASDRVEDIDVDLHIVSMEMAEDVRGKSTTPDARPADTEVAAKAIVTGVQDSGSVRDSASSTSHFLRGEHSITGSNAGEEGYPRTQISGNLGTISKRDSGEETGIDRARSQQTSKFGFPGNGDQDENKKKESGCTSSKAHRDRGSSKDAYELGGETAKGLEDNENSVLDMPLEWRLALERRQHEESVLARAEDVWAKQEILETSRKVPSKGKEPARCKTHWDFVLEEMTWLAKDFERERKWKLSQAKKVASRVSRSKLDVEAKGLRRQREEEQKIRRVASNIAKDVKKFWMKVEKLVMYKHQLELEERRKKALDKHLDFLLGQTERYSTMLAENLGESSAPWATKALPPVPLLTCSDSTGDDPSASGKEIVVRNDDSVPLKVADGANEFHQLLTTNSTLEREGVAPESECARSFLPELGVTILKSDADGGDEEYTIDNDDEEEDDEATIAAEEALVTKEEQKEELTALKREQELPLEELIKLYGRSEDVSDGTDYSDEEQDGDFDSHDDVGDEKKISKVEHDSMETSHPVDLVCTPSSAHPDLEASVEGSKMLADKLQLETSTSTLSLDDKLSGVHGTEAAKVQSIVELSTDSSVKEDTYSPRVQGVSAEKKGTVNGDLSVVTSGAETKDICADDGEYIPAALVDGTDEDDETTLDEEEVLARAEAVDHADEVDRLKRENEMSIEDLLAQYRTMASDSDEDEDTGDDFVEDRQDRTSEAGTSGSSDDDEDVDYKCLVEDSMEAKERMGEPSTSGRERSLVSSSYGRKPKKKPFEIPDTDEENKSKNRSSGGPDIDEIRLHKQLKVDFGFAENGQTVETLRKKGGSGVVSLVLGTDEVVDEATVEALARVSAASACRDERVLKRAQREEEPSALLVDLSGGTTDDVERRANAVKENIPGVQGIEEFDNSVEARNIELERTRPGLAGKSSPGGASEFNADEAAETGEEKTSEDKLADAAAAAQSAQPTGYTFSTTKVRTKLPFLLKHSLREYQHIGLDWLVTMYEKRLNGILADEMGLGKTIMTISLLAHLACERGIWGPHLIVVPTSVMLNWETEFMKWCPAFKILTYFGSAKERKIKRQGWSKPNNFHVCITTYRLVIQDAKAFKRKKWKYLILDEAHLIKNWKSQRWQTLLNFNSKRRILLTGTPLQNDLMELWSLMHFLMPHVFQSHQEFRDWFSNPITGMVEGQEQINKEVVDRLHNVLRPFLLRRLKKDVEKQLPQKYEHVIHCRLSKRQRNLYEDFMASSDTQATLSTGNFLGLINVLMQLRKVCNHPDLFEGRPIVSSFDMVGLDLHLSSLATSALQLPPFASVSLAELNLLVKLLDLDMTSWECEEASELCTPGILIEELSSTGEDSWTKGKDGPNLGIIEEVQAVIRAERVRQKKEKVRALMWLNVLRCGKNVLYGSDLRKCVSVESLVYDVHKIKADPRRYLEFSSVLADIVQLPLTRLQKLMGLVESFVFAIPAARAPAPVAWCSHPASPSVLSLLTMEESLHDTVSASLEPLRPVFVRSQLFFPDRRLLQFDCGKLQELAILLRRLKSEGHRALIFTQMTRMLDVLESFINLYGYTYMRLDGSTKPEQRQILMQRFNTNPKIFLFILSTRSGGVGINLVGADTVIFYDSDWNPAMDQQAQDRCHRIGQTREVNIYRLVSESTIEENILKKANQKRMLDDLVIQSGSYNTEFFKKLDPMELFSGLKGVKVGGGSMDGGLLQASEVEGVAGVKPPEVSSAEVEAALKNAEDEADYMAMKKVEQEEAAENQEFTEEGFVANMEDEELVDDLEEGKIAAGRNQADGAPKEATDTLQVIASDDGPQVGTALITAEAEEEMDMLADVKQMAAAAAASGRGSISFEDQLQPVERYAMRFLELWDPRVDKASEAAQVQFEEKEWELDQLEKLKEEQEAEIDEDNEPLFYESWDTTFANEAYRQQVEVLAQQQENQRQLEWEAMEEEMRDADRAAAEAAEAVVGAENFKVKSKSLKKLKNMKFRSLKKGSLTSEEMILVKRNLDRDENYSSLPSEMSSLPSRSPSQRKRKAPKLLEEEILTEVHTKKPKKDGQRYMVSGASLMSKMASEVDQMGGASDEDTRDSDVTPTHSKFPVPNITKKMTKGKISIMAAPLKKGPLIMLEKERKKDGARRQVHVPPADVWTVGEDAVLCAVVHEYGGNWQLATDALAGMPDGNNYRGRHRHPFHCRERFRQLLSQNATTAADGNSEKSVPSAASSASMKVTEEHTKRLLEIIVQLPDNELLLQRHFTAVLYAVKNKVARDQTESNVPVGNGDRIIVAPEGKDFILCSKLIRTESCPSVAPSGATANVSPGDMLSLVGEALASTEGNEDEMMEAGDLIGTAGDEIPTEGETKPDEEGNFMGYLDSDYISSVVISAEGSELPAVGNRYMPLSADDLFRCTPVARSGSCFAKAFQGSAENTAEQRFRRAMTSGWGPGLYDWASAASSGLGSASVPSRTKLKKRPPQADSARPPKPKQPRLPKVGKKTRAENSTPVVENVSAAVSGAALHRNSDIVLPDPTLNRGVSDSKETSFGGFGNFSSGESEPRQMNADKLNSSKLKSSAGGSSSKRKPKKTSAISASGVGIITPTGVSKIKSFKLKNGSATFGLPGKRSVGDPSTVEVLPDIDASNVRKQPLREVSSLAEIEILSPDPGSAFDDLEESGSDDENGVTGPSGLNPQIPSSVTKTVRGGIDRSSIAYVEVETLDSEKSSSSRIRKVGSLGPKVAKQKPWSGGANFPRFPQNIQLEVPVSVSGWVPKAGGDSSEIP
ncbi:hypothetical protein R1flu_024669 [Riccia fluitans]|uniref:DNA helicase n=1 Tax=Riccia fluitans TaxID=41844 RepID=A0ABD1XVJ4_9MARC